MVVPRKKLELAIDAVPQIFPNLPRYLSADTAPSRASPDVRRQERISINDKKYEKWLLEDKFSSLDEMLNNTNIFNHSKWLLKKDNNKVYFLKIDFTESPAVRAVLILDGELNVNVICDNVKVQSKNFEWILGPKLVCDSYSKLENILTSVHNSEAKNINLSDKIKYIQVMLGEIIDKNENNEIKLRFQFISEQLGLLVSKRTSYSSDLLLTAATFFFSFPAAYRFLRDLKLLVLPHMSYLKTFNLSSIDGCINRPLEMYLETKCQALKSYERLGILLLDEIYVKPKITYKGNKVVGMAKNSNELQTATTVQTFMFKSILSDNKDVVAMLPVKNLNSDFLFHSTLQVLSLLNHVGYEVVAIISDNNKVNVKCYKALCNDNSIKPFIVHPSDNTKIVHLLFDTVHILKNLRNNWLNEKNMTFIYPSVHVVDEIKQCKFHHVRLLYEKEKQSMIKHAPGLSYKVCFPNSIERQNVSLVVPLFEDKTITAMSTLMDGEAKDTAEWLQIIRNWWLVVNVKHPNKGICLREKLAEPVRSMEQENLKYLVMFCDWLQKWNSIFIVDAPARFGKLSRETFSALLHTTETLIKLCDYLLNVKQLHYVMLGVFQTDDLEQRFGKYRFMSGCNYNISVQQIIESERRLKVTSLLKLRSRNSVSFNVAEIISDINACADDNVDSEAFEESEMIVQSCLEIEMDDSTLQVIIFIAGYVSFKVGCKVTCSSCKSLLIVDQEVHFEAPDELRYLDHLNRGGLKYPSAISVDIGVHVYKIFEVFLSKDNEIKFLSCANPKALIKCVLLELLEPLYDDDICECGKPLLEVVNICMNIWVNILFNNYSKVKNNACIEENHCNKKKRDFRSSSEYSAIKSRKLGIFH